MRKNWTLLGIALVVAILAIGAVACGGDDEDEDEAPTATEEQVDDAADADDDGDNDTADADDADDAVADESLPTATDIPAPVATEAPAPLPTDLPDDFTIGDDVLLPADVFNRGGILTDVSSFTLYVFDSDDAGVSNCIGGCLDIWPPYLAGCPSCNLIAEDGLSGTVSITADEQLTYNGQPLYYYSGDLESGDRNGDGIGGVWHVVVVGG